MESGGNLASINTKTPALGQALAAGSVPVVLPAAQLTTLTPPTSVGLNAGSAKIGIVTTDQTTHGTTDLVAADITKVNGSGIATGNGTAAGAIRVALPTDGTGVVGINAATGLGLGTAKLVASNNVGSISTIMTTELNSLANNSSVVSSVAGASGVITTPTQPQMRVQLTVTFGTAPTANTTILVWFLQSIDGGTTFEDGSSSIMPTRNPDAIFTVNAITSAQVLQKICDAPIGNFKVLVKNNGTGQGFAASANTIKILPYTKQQQ